MNKSNDIKYIRADHAVIGLEYVTDWKSRFTISFYKDYSRYPFSLNDSISLANVGSDFGVVGNEEVEGPPRMEEVMVWSFYTNKN